MVARQEILDHMKDMFDNNKFPKHITPIRMPQLHFKIEAEYRPFRRCGQQGERRFTPTEYCREEETSATTEGKEDHSFRKDEGKRFV